MLIGGAFGQYINIEKAIQIGLLPDLPWERFHFLGNTSVKGAYMALLSRDARIEIAEAAAKLTYLELSADNAFYDCFTSALFLPHTEISRFPSVQALLRNGRGEVRAAARGGSGMSQPTVFDRNPRLTQPAGRLAWQESFGPMLGELRAQLQERRPESDRRSLRAQRGMNRPAHFPSPGWTVRSASPGPI